MNKVTVYLQVIKEAGLNISTINSSGEIKGRVAPAFYIVMKHFLEKFCPVIFNLNRLF
jgi:hypothetical protein